MPRIVVHEVRRGPIAGLLGETRDAAPSARRSDSSLKRRSSAGTPDAAATSASATPSNASLGRPEEVQQRLQKRIAFPFAHCRQLDPQIVLLAPFARNHRERAAGKAQNPSLGQILAASRREPAYEMLTIAHRAVEVIDNHHALSTGKRATAESVGDLAPQSNRSATSARCDLQPLRQTLQELDFVKAGDVDRNRLAASGAAVLGEDSEDGRLAGAARSHNDSAAKAALDKVLESR